MIRIGTSGFSFPDWKGPVYPLGIRERDMLYYYEKELWFNALEVNFTYYALIPESFAAMSPNIERVSNLLSSFKG
jgi:uncharacterized protein YecE (DUF72 family)